MITVKLNGKTTNAYNIYDFPYGDVWKDVRYVEHSKRCILDKIATFDIESTNMPKGDRYETNWAFMYVWQFCIDGIVIMGRTWNEYIYFLKKLKKGFPSCSELIVYVHNLQFEFQFMRNFFDFTDVFCRKVRQVVKCRADWIEYRCSYILTNMSLDKFLQKTRGVTWYKQTGKFDYLKIRYPDTKLTEEEILYCVCDVLGLYQAINSLLDSNNCNLASVPLTSTGFVRRDYRDKCLNDESHMKRFKRGELNECQYNLLVDASRGGIAGSNAVNTGWNLTNVDSEDIKSSYPYQMATKYFPRGGFNFVNCKWGSDSFYDYINHYCCIIVWSVDELKLYNWDTIPYISKSKCKGIVSGKFGNGKVYSADTVIMCTTEIDLKIITEKYSFKHPVIYKMMVSERGMLSKAFRERLLEMFQTKTELEDGDPYDYVKFKNKVNASFGMMLTNILHPEIVYNPRSDKIFMEDKIVDVPKALKKYYSGHSNFLSYQDGIWVLAHGREDLSRGMDIVGEDCVQVDTDAVKHFGNYRTEFDALNAITMEMAESYSVKPYAIGNDGKKVYLGIWEHEVIKKGGGSDNDYTYPEFRTLGAKKYAYRDFKGKLHITVSGVPTENGAKWLEKNGLEAMRPGKTISANESGRLVAYYNDESEIKTRIINGHDIRYGSNVCLLPGAYTFGVTDEWDEMIHGDWDFEMGEDNMGV